MTIPVEIDTHLKNIYYQKGYWSDQTLLDMFYTSRDKNPLKPFVIDDRGKTITYQETDKLAEGLAAYLKSQGVKTGDVISFQMPNWAEYAIIIVACLKIGAVMHPLSRTFNERDLLFILHQVHAAAFICPTFAYKTRYEDMISSIKRAVSSLKCILVCDRMSPSNHHYTTISQTQNTEHQQKITQPTCSSDDVALILSTSGTTGTPKAVLLTHNNLIFSERVFCQALKLTEDDVMFMPAPLNHATGFNHGLIAPLILGGSCVLQEKFDATRAIDLIDTYQVTWSMGATPFIYDLLNEYELTHRTPKTLRFYLCGGAPVPGNLVHQARTCGIVLCEVYGSTESCPHVLVPPIYALGWNGSFSGVALPGIETKIVDTNLNELPYGEQGEELSRGPHLFVGYLNNPEATQKAITPDGWFRSGDLATMDKRGRIKINGRIKEIIIRGGVNISAVEVDNTLAGYSEITDCATIGIPDDRLGERICTFIVSPRQISLTDLTSYLSSIGIPKRLWPEHIEYIDQIPRTESGKIKRNELSRILKERLSMR